jgi:hypothetical protein
MAQLVPAVMSSNSSLEDWEKSSIERKEKEGCSRHRTQEVEKGSARIRKEVTANHMRVSGISLANKCIFVRTSKRQVKTLTA